MAHTMLSNAERDRLTQVGADIKTLENSGELAKAMRIAVGGRKPKTGQIVKLSLRGPWGEYFGLLNERAILLATDKHRKGEPGF